MNRVTQTLYGANSGLTNLASTLFPSSGSTGFYGLTSAQQLRLSNFVSTTQQIIFPVAGNTGIYGLTTAAYTRLYNFLAQGLYSADAGIANLTQAVLPVTGNTGIYGLTTGAYTRLYDFFAQALYGADVGIAKLTQAVFPLTGAVGIYGLQANASARFNNFMAEGLYGANASGIANLVQRVYSNAPTAQVATTVASAAAASAEGAVPTNQDVLQGVAGGVASADELALVQAVLANSVEGRPGIQEKAIINGESFWTVTAGCANGVFLTGGFYEVSCTASTVSALGTPPNAARLLELASHIVGLTSAGIITGKTVVSGGVYTAESAKVIATAVGSTDPNLDYYGPIIAPQC